MGRGGSKKNTTQLVKYPRVLSVRPPDKVFVFSKHLTVHLILILSFLLITAGDLIFDIDGDRFALQPIQASGGVMYLKFTSNSAGTAPGFKATVKKYQVIVGKK